MTEESSATSPTTKAPVPPFTDESAARKARLAEDAWNTCDPHTVSMAYSADSRWRNRSTFMTGRDEIVEFLADKWSREHEYRLIKEPWAHRDDRIAVRFAYEYRVASGQWFRAYGNENWQFDAGGLMTHRHASINDLPIDDADRKFFWDRNGPRPADHPSLSDLDL